jgi:hypothetical protein
MKKLLLFSAMLLLIMSTAQAQFRPRVEQEPPMMIRDLKYQTGGITKTIMERGSETIFPVYLPDDYTLEKIKKDIGELTGTYFVGAVMRDWEERPALRYGPFALDEPVYRIDFSGDGQREISFFFSKGPEPKVLVVFNPQI